jgi:hypothetical protein
MNTKRQIEKQLQTAIYTKLTDDTYATYDGIWFTLFTFEGQTWIDFEDDDIACTVGEAKNVLAWIRYDRGITNDRPELEPYEMAGVKTSR